jgi:hypothetical protein
MRMAIGRTIVLAIVAAGVAYADARTPRQQTPQQPSPSAQQAGPRRPASPAGTAATQVGGKWVGSEKPGAPPRYQDGKWIEVTYSRPILRGRKEIFGAGAEYGKTVSGGDPVWRAGANQTTRLTTEAPLAFGGKALPPGEYSMFVDLKPGAWTLIFSKQPFQQKYDPANKVQTWGATNYDQAQDVIRVPMTVEQVDVSVDQFTIAFVDMTQQGGKLAMFWDRTMATAPFTVGS